MKKLFLILIFSVLGFYLWAQEITIMSYNIAHNNAYKKANYEEWINQICTLIKGNSADIVLLQEVPVVVEKGFVSHEYQGIEIHFKKPQTHTILDDIKEGLGEEWEYLSTAEYLLHTGVTVDGVDYSGGDMAQNNAVFYNTEKALALDMADELGFTRFPDCDYRFNKNNIQVLYFSSENENGEVTYFIVSNVHLQSKNSMEKRNSDLQNLEDLLLNEFGGELFDLPILVGGDFNTTRDEFGLIGFDGYIIDGGSSPKTTLSTKADKFKYANDFDHFVYNPALMKKIKNATRRAVFGDSGRNLEKENSFVLNGVEFKSSQDIREKLSDHVPIVLTVEF